MADLLESINEPTLLIALAAAMTLVIGGLLVYGLRDLAKFSLRRTLAVASVARREGIRRKVLWVTPLAMLAVLLLVRLQTPVDEPDAIRQAQTFGLFASGFVVILVMLVLSCTNLPKEIDSRVIFTIVTKPLTRLELLLGKIAGFAHLSLIVLGIMGLFNYGLLRVMEHRLSSSIQSRLDAGLENPTRRLYLQSLATGGLLRADMLAEPEALNVLAKLHQPGDEFRYTLPSQYYAAVPFEIPAEVADNLIFEDGEYRDAVLAVSVRGVYEVMEGRFVYDSDLPLGVVNLEDLPEPPAPPVQIQVHDQNLYTLVARTMIPRSSVRLIKRPDEPVGRGPFIWLTAQQSRQIARVSFEGPIYITVWGISGDHLYGFNSDSVRLHVIPPERVADAMFRAGNDPVFETFEPSIQSELDVIYRTTRGTDGQGITGPEQNIKGQPIPAPYGVFSFQDVPTPTGDAAFTLDLDVERNSTYFTNDELVEVEVSLLNRATGAESQPQIVSPETGKPVAVVFANEFVDGGNFDLQLRTRSSDNIVSVSGDRIRYAIATDTFEVNLVKALLVQWLLSVLVIVCGLTFSTLLSWPIAVVLVVIFLSGRWVGDQLGLGDESFGRTFTQQLMSDESSAAAFQTVEQGVTAVGEVFRVATSVLPDAGVFDATSDIRASVSLEWTRVLKAVGLVMLYGLPLLTLAYILLRNKEVAP